MADEGVRPAPGEAKPAAAPTEEDKEKAENAKLDEKDVKEAASTGKMLDGKPIMDIKVYSPFKTFYDEPAFSITAVNLTGPFDILPRHHNFITLVEPCELVIQAPAGEKRIKISGAVMHVKADRVTVLLDA